MRAGSKIGREKRPISSLLSQRFRLPRRSLDTSSAWPALPGFVLSDYAALCSGNPFRVPETPPTARATSSGCVGPLPRPFRYPRRCVVEVHSGISSFSSRAKRSHVWHQVRACYVCEAHVRRTRLLAFRRVDAKSALPSGLCERDACGRAIPDARRVSTPGRGRGRRSETRGTLRVLPDLPEA